VVRVFDYPAEYVAKGKRLKIIARNGTGYDSIDLPACKEHGVIVTNVPGGNAPVRSSTPAAHRVKADRSRPLASSPLPSPLP
jgi:D-3-phosphoglycerate dehydrogenase